MIRPIAVAACLLSGCAAQAQMSLPGKFEVTDTGSASYTIPINVVPGTAGLEPKLSLQYDSRAGNGLLGVGWSLAGLPAITRCGRTIAQDGAVGGVSYDANDRFCLDGQRLIAISGSYGADQTEYRTERESFSKVVSYGSAGSGPAWFKVWTKAGLVMEFGNTADSCIEAQGKSSARVWAINKTSDTKGNWFSVSYAEDNTNGEYRPSRIDYTGNSTVVPVNSVRFVYETRPDIVPMYQAGSLIRTTQRMTKVQVWQGEVETREYKLSYQQSSTIGLSLLNALSWCDGVGDCFPATSVTWENGADASSLSARPQQQLLGGGYVTPNWTPHWVDMNGDGRADLVMLYQNSSNGIVNATVLLSQEDGSFANILGQQALLSGGYVSPNWMPYWVDINGDGLTDLVMLYQNSTNGIVSATALLSQGNGAFTVLNQQQLLSGGYVSPNWTPHWIDVNGDGKIDLVMLYQNSSNGNVSATVMLSQGDGTFTNVFGQQPLLGDGYVSTNWVPHWRDVNGDGLADLIMLYQNSTNGVISATALLSQGNGTFSVLSQQPLLGGGYVSTNWTPHWVDVNGDGKIDLVMLYQNSSNGNVNATVMLSQGDGKFINVLGQQPLLSGGYVTPYWVPRWADVNGDGKADLIMLYQNSSDGIVNATVLLSQGNGAFINTGHQQLLGGGYVSTNWTPHWVDVTGYGRSDLVLLYQNVTNGIVNATPVLASSAHLSMSKAISGHGAVTSVVYAPLSRSASSYTKDSASSACTYPCNDVQGAVYVVSEVKSSNGLGIAGAGGEYRSTYRYAGAKADSHGRGFLGFRQMTVRDEQTGVEQVTSYRQDYPFTGLVVSREKKLGAQLLNRSTNTYSATDLGGTRRYPFLTTSLEESWELSGAALPAVTTSYQYDAFGNATQVGVSTGDGHSKATANTYSNDAANWLLGRLIRSEVTSTTPGN